MALDKALKFVDAARPKIVDQNSARRHRLVRAIDQQIAKCNAETTTQRPAKRAWWWQDAGGSYFVEVRYGRKSLELSKGKHAVRCDNLTAIEEALRLIRASVLEGELDEKLEQAGREFRARFSKRA